jgi:hypothetical protein
MKPYYNTLCSIFTLLPQVLKWSKVSWETALYENIKSAVYQKTSRYGQTTQAVQTDSNSFTMVVDWKYTWINIWDIVKINWVTYKIMNIPLPHEKINGRIDNFEFSINRTTTNG